jgi:hypothetical protein
MSEQLTRRQTRVLGFPMENWTSSYCGSLAARAMAARPLARGCGRRPVYVTWA